MIGKNNNKFKCIYLCKFILIPYPSITDAVTHTHFVLTDHQLKTYLIDIFIDIFSLQIEDEDEINGTGNYKKLNRKSKVS